MNKVHLIKQHDEKDCGAASLAMLLDFFGKKIPIASVREAIKVDQYGASIYGLIDGAKKYDVLGEAYEDSAGNVWDAMKEDGDCFPAILRILNRGGFEHFIVVAGISKDKLEIFDPDMGKFNMDKATFESCFLGQIVVFKPKENFKKENLKKGQFSKFTAMIFKQKNLLAYIAVLSLLVTGIGIAGSYIFQYIIDAGLNDIAYTDGAAAWFQTFLVLMAGLAVMYVFKSGIQMLRGKLLTIMSKNIDIPLMLGYYNHVADLPMNFFETRKTGEITSRINDAAKIRDALSNVTLTLMIDVVMVVGCGVVLYKTSPILFFISTFVFVLYIVVSTCYIRPLDKMNREVMENDAQFSSYLKESIDGMETVKVSQAESIIKGKMASLFEKCIDSNMRGAMLSLGKNTIVEAITSIGNLCIICVGVYLIVNGKMTTGTLITFNMLLSYFLSPVQNLVEVQSNLQTAIVAADRLNDILNIKPEIQDGHRLSDLIHEISMEHVDFRYGNRDRVLNDLSIRIQAGEKIALVGESGCGKSTVTKLLMGMQIPENGKISINGEASSEIALADLRKRIAFVPQTTFLFSGSIRENLMLGIEDPDKITDQRINKVLKACCCDFVDNMPFGVDSMLEENGVNLSGGQRQRLAIARALLRDPEILILDEATSALDTITENKIQKAFEEIVPDAMVVMIAHRLSTASHCSKIYVMDKGTVIECGNHQDLLNQKGRYLELWNRQNSFTAA